MTEQKGNLKLLLLGAQGSGKTALVHRYKTNKFVSVYTPDPYLYTERIAATPWRFSENLDLSVDHDQRTVIDLMIGHNVDEVDQRPDGLILIFNTCRMDTLQRLPDLLAQMTQKFGVLPMIVVGTAVESSKRTVSPRTCHTLIGHDYIEVSAKSGYQHDRPFLHFIRPIEPDEVISCDSICDSISNDFDENSE